MPTEVAVHPNVTLDLTGVACPGPILGVTKLIAELRAGEVLLLISDCPGTNDDLYAWAARTGNRVLESERFASGVTGYYVQRGRPEREASVVLDLRGFVCPGPIVEARRVLQGMASGATLKLLSDCPGALADMKDWARITGTELTHVAEVGPQEWEFYVRRP